MKIVSYPEKLNINIKSDLLKLNVLVGNNLFYNNNVINIDDFVSYKYSLKLKFQIKFEIYEDGINIYKKDSSYGYSSFSGKKYKDITELISLKEIFEDCYFITCEFNKFEKEIYMDKYQIILDGDNLRIVEKDSIILKTNNFNFIDIINGDRIKLSKEKFIEFMANNVLYDNDHVVESLKDLIYNILSKNKDFMKYNMVLARYIRFLSYDRFKMLIYLDSKEFYDLFKDFVDNNIIQYGKDETFNVINKLNPLLTKKEFPNKNTIPKLNTEIIPIYNDLLDRYRGEENKKEKLFNLFCDMEKHDLIKVDGIKLINKFMNQYNRFCWVTTNYDDKMIDFDSIYDDYYEIFYKIIIKNKITVTEIIEIMLNEMFEKGLSFKDIAKNLLV